MSFTLIKNASAWRKLGNAGPVVLTKVAQVLAGEQQRRSPAKTGTNRRSVMFDLPTRATARTFTTSGYGGWLEIGTGLYGPRKQRIRPRVKKALYWRGAAHPVKSVRGRRATPYMVPAAKNIRGRLETDLKHLLEE